MRFATYRLGRTAGLAAVGLAALTSDCPRTRRRTQRIWLHPFPGTASGLWPARKPPCSMKADDGIEVAVEKMYFDIPCR